MPYTSCTDTSLVPACCQLVIFLLNVQTRAALFKYFSERTVSVPDTCAGNVHDDVICCEVHVLNFANRLGRNRQKTTNTSDCMLLLAVSYLSFQQLMCVYMYMHCILFMFSCNFLVTVQENYKPLFSSCILGDTILCEYRFNFRSTQAYRLNLSINLSFCFKNNLGCDQMFPNTFNKGVSLHAHTRPQPW